MGALLGLIVSLQSCLKGCELPDLEAYRYGLLDGMPEGTQAVFESNTGKLDTATYGPIVKKVNRVDNTRARCEQQFTNVHYEEQDIDFKNKFGFKKLAIKRYSYNKSDGKDTALHFFFQIDTLIDNNRYYLENFTNIVNTKATSFYDCDSVKNRINNVLYAKSYFSKSKGIIKIIYQKQKSADSIFTFKTIIKWKNT